MNVVGGKSGFGRDVGRLHALDGMRGLAAAVVLITHTQNLGARFAANEGVDVDWSWLTSTPLRLLISGSEAVMVFFVLSGLVVALPALRWRTFKWAAYYPRRLVRLYLPVFASVLLAIALLLLVPWDDRPAVGGWYDRTARADNLHAGDIVLQSLLVIDEPPINMPLWSLTWEVVFSLLLPLYVILAIVCVGRWAVLGGAAALTLLAVGGATHFAPLLYLPVFFLGTLAAANLDSIRRWGAKLTSTGSPSATSSQRRLRALVPWALLAGCWLLIVGPALWSWLPTAASTLGAAGVVVLAIVWRPFVTMLEFRPVQWLGKVSFSLYLVHTPVLTTAIALVQGVPWWVGPAVGFVASLIVAALFQWLVEAPAHRLSQRVGRWVATRRPVEAAASPTPVSPPTHTSAHPGGESS